MLSDLSGLDGAFDLFLARESARLAVAARHLGERLLNRAPADDLMQTAELLLAVDPAHEGAWRAIIRTHVRRGDRSAAASSFARCQERLAVLGLDPSTETLELMGAIRQPRLAASVPAKPREPSRATLRIGIMPPRSLDPEQELGLGLGLAEEITTALAPFRGLACVSSSSLGAIADEPRSGNAWSSLDLDFLLEGTIHSDCERHRLAVRLLDMRAGEAVVWARRFEPASDDLLALQDEMASAIAGQLVPELIVHEGERAAARRHGDATGHELMLRAMPAIYRLDCEGFIKAGDMLERALKLDPQNAAAHAWFAHWHIFFVGQGWAPDPKAASRRATELGERAVLLDPNDARALALAGHVRGFLSHRPDDARALHERALALNPNLALAWCLSGLSQVYLGNHVDAIRRIKQAQFISPYDPHGFFFEMALAMPYMLLGDLDQAVQHGQRAVELNPGFSSSYKPYLAALGLLRRTGDSALARLRLMRLEPGLTVRNAVERSPLTHRDDRHLYAEGLRLAGLAEM